MLCSFARSRFVPYPGWGARARDVNELTKFYQSTSRAGSGSWLVESDYSFRHSNED
jgi:hypothetical protein